MNVVRWWLIACLVPSMVYAEVGMRPTVALVLGGGGARAGAEVGVIELLEELQIPVDYVVGTSMGSFIGALYAMGYSAAEIREILLTADWNTLFSPEIDRDDIDFQRREAESDFLVKYRLNLKEGKPSLPLGIISSSRLQRYLTELSIPLGTIDDFNQLPVPFRAVAADLDTGASVALERGNLAQAVATSMAVPGVFPPVVLDGKLLVDGGIVNNVPVSVAQALQADILIVVSVGAASKDISEMANTLDVLRRTVRLLTKRSSSDGIDLMTEKDILIEPELGQISTENYDQIESTFALGRAAALKHLSKLQALRVSSADYQHYQSKRRRFIANNPTEPSIDFVQVQASEKLKRLIRARLSIKPGETFDSKQLDRELEQIAVLGYFDDVTYQFINQEDKTGILVSATEKSTGVDFLRFGARFEDNFAGVSDYSFRASYTKSLLNRYGASLRLDAQIGQTRGLQAEFYQPLDYRGRYFIDLEALVAQSELNTFINGKLIKNFRLTSEQLDLSFGRNFGQKTRVSVGISKARTEVENLFDALFPGSEGIYDDNAWLAQATYDSFDNITFPSKGLFASLGWRGMREYLAGEENLDTFQGSFNYAFSVNRNTFVLGAEFGEVSNSKPEVQNTLGLGGLFRLSGYQFNELQSGSYGFARGIYYYQLGRGRAALNFPIYLGGSLELIDGEFLRNDLLFNETLLAGSVFIGLDTPLVPIYLGYGLAEGFADEDSRSSVYLFVGQPF